MKKECEECGVTYTASKFVAHIQKYCSKKCQWEAWYKTVKNDKSFWKKKNIYMKKFRTKNPEYREQHKEYMKNYRLKNHNE